VLIASRSPPGEAAATVVQDFDGYLTTYLERDLRDLAAVSDPGDFQRPKQPS